MARGSFLDGLMNGTCAKERLKAKAVALLVAVQDGQKSDAKSFLIQLGSEIFPKGKIEISEGEDDESWKDSIKELLEASDDEKDFNLVFGES